MRIKNRISKKTLYSRNTTFSKSTNNNIFNSVISTIQLVSFILVALYSCVYAFRRLTRPGMSREIRIVFIRKHIFYVMTFIILWTFSLSHLYFQIY